MTFDAVGVVCLPFQTDPETQQHGATAGLFFQQESDNPPLPRQEQAHFTLSGTRLHRSTAWTLYLFAFFCLLRASRQTGKGPRPMHSGPQGKADLVAQRTDWTSEHSHSHSLLLSTP